MRKAQPNPRMKRVWLFITLVLLGEIGLTVWFCKTHPSPDKPTKESWIPGPASTPTASKGTGRPEK